MNRKILMIASLVIALGMIGGGAWFWTTRARHDEQAISEVLATRATALNQKDLSLLLSCFSVQYRSVEKNGEKTYADLQADASRWFENFATIHFSFQMRNVQIQQHVALVENAYKFVLTNMDGETREIPGRELLELQRESGGWKITRARVVQ